MTKHFVEYVYAGLFVSEIGTEEIQSRDQVITLPKGAYAYRIFDREEVEQGGETLKGAPKNYGPRHIKGEVYDLDRVKREVPDSRILVSNMECNGLPNVIKCLQGFLPANADDVLLAV